MINETNENRMLEELGLNNSSPFKTPDGYFDTLTQRVMDRIDEEENTTHNAKVVKMNNNKKSTWGYVSKWVVAAAACLVIVFGGINYFETNTGTIAQSQNTLISTDDYDEEYEEDMMYYSMMDEQDIYCYLSGME